MTENARGPLIISFQVPVPLIEDSLDTENDVIAIQAIEKIFSQLGMLRSDQLRILDFHRDRLLEIIEIIESKTN